MPRSARFWLTVAGLGGLLFVTLFLQRAVNRGITVREQLAGDLEQAKQRLEVTLMSIGDAVIASDERGRITRMNPVAERLTGWRLARGRRPTRRKGFSHRE